MVRARSAAVGLVVAVAGVVAGVGVAPARGADPIPGWGEPVDPDRDCTVRLDGKALTVAVPAGAHGLGGESGPKNAPRVLRDVEGNWAATVQVAETSPPADPGPRGSRGAGLLLWEDENNFIRFARVSAAGPGGQGVRGTVALETCQDGQLRVVASADAPAAAGRTAWLRLTRRGEKLRAEVSGDGKAWTELYASPVRLSSRLSLGAVAANDSPAPFAARFEGFQVKAVPLYP